MGRGGQRPAPLRRVVLAVLVLALLAALTGSAARAVAQPITTTTPPPAPPLPKAWALVDADTGAVVSAGNARERRYVASVVKVLTALVVVESLRPDDAVPVTPRAEAMPARKVNLKVGQLWRAGDLLHALLLVSANDAAVALAHRIGGSDEGFAQVLARSATRLRLADAPVLQDPSGLDDQFSYRGGNVISARDLAIVARAALRHPEVTRIATLREYRFEGGDGLPHRFLNHNRLLQLYPGAVGLKTGYTKRAGRTLIAAARRDGRTMIAVVLDAVDTYGAARLLLDQGFSIPTSAQQGLDRLPPVPGPHEAGTADAGPAELAAARPAAATRASRTGAATATPAPRSDRETAQAAGTDDGDGSGRNPLAYLLPGLLVVAFLGRREQIKARKRRRHRSRAQRAAAGRRAEARRATNTRAVTLVSPDPRAAIVDPDVPATTE